MLLHWWLKFPFIKRIQKQKVSFVCTLIVLALKFVYTVNKDVYLSRLRYSQDNGFWWDGSPFYVHYRWLLCIYGHHFCAANVSMGNFKFSRNFRCLHKLLNEFNLSCITDWKANALFRSKTLFWLVVLSIEAVSWVRFHWWRPLVCVCVHCVCIKVSWWNIWFWMQIKSSNELKCCCLFFANGNVASQMIAHINNQQSTHSRSYTHTHRSSTNCWKCWISTTPSKSTPLGKCIRY